MSDTAFVADFVAVTKPVPATPLLTLPQAREASNGQNHAPLATLLAWVEGYLMNGHAELGRTGAVCPFTRQSSRIDAARVAICQAAIDDEDTVFALIRDSFTELDAIPAKPSMAHFRTIIIGFPQCDTQEGIAMLVRVQKRLTWYSLRRNRMIGLMHADSQAKGLWNADFRPLRAPLPVLAVRHMVEQDAPFAARHPRLLLPYLARYPWSGTKRLIAHWRGRN